MSARRSGAVSGPLLISAKTPLLGSEHMPTEFTKQSGASELKPTIIERALQLASSGTIPNMLRLEKQLSGEGYTDVHAHLHGASIRRKLNMAMRAERAVLSAGSKVPEA